MPNKVTTAAREAFLLTFKKLEGELEGWIRQTASGWETVRLTKDGQTVTLIEGRDPAKAADLLVRMAEYHFPKLGRQEITGADGAPLAVFKIEEG